MPWWLPLLIKYGVPLLLSKDVINEEQALAIKIWYLAKYIVKTVDIDPDYDINKNNQKSEDTYMKSGNNFNKS